MDLTLGDVETTALIPLVSQRGRGYRFMNLYPRPRFMHLYPANRYAANSHKAVLFLSLDI